MIYIKIAACIGLVVFFIWYGDHREAEGYKAGSAAIQVEWDQDKAQIQKAADIALAAVTADKEKALADNASIQATYQSQLAAADASAADLVRRLHDYQTRAAANPGSVPKGNSRPGPAPAAPIPSASSLDAAIGDAAVECAANEAQLRALQSELKSQLQ
jgi:hypothetical protein